MFCPRCGAQNPDDANFCSGCGYQLSGGVVYAGFWRRFAAFLIDAIILAIGWSILRIVIYDIYDYDGGEDIGPYYMWGFERKFDGIMQAILGWLYYALLESSSLQATLGKMALGIIVTDLNGNRISFLKATARYWSKIISTIIVFVGYVMAAFTEKKQALHDIIAGTLVVKKK